MLCYSKAAGLLQPPEATKGNHFINDVSDWLNEEIEEQGQSQPHSSIILEELCIIWASCIQNSTMIVSSSKSQAFKIRMLQLLTCYNAFLERPTCAEDQIS
jgi:hypothetical protein